MDRAFLLNKFVDKKNVTVNQTIIKEKMNDILDDKEVSEKNLIEHKKTILELIGFVNREEDERYLMEVEKKNLEKDVRDLVY